ncbi:hypothetical protein BB558_002207, partial [Smittium angustum]
YKYLVIFTTTNHILGEEVLGCRSPSKVSGALEVGPLWAGACSPLKSGNPVLVVRENSYAMMLSRRLNRYTARTTRFLIGNSWLLLALITQIDIYNLVQHSDICIGIFISVLVFCLT